MARLVGVLLACLFLVAPSADALCRAWCTPLDVTASPSCHDTSEDGPRVTTAGACQRPLVIAAPLTDARRSLAAATLAPIVVPAAVGDVPLRAGVPGRPPRVRPRPVQACPSCIVLRI